MKEKGFSQILTLFLVFMFIMSVVGCGKKQEQYYERGLKTLETSKQLSAGNDLRLIADALSRYYMENNELPQGDIQDVMNVLVPTYLRVPITRSGGQLIEYTSTGTTFELRAAGPDGKLHTADDLIVAGP